jgi:hypothetical protein
VVSRGYGRTQRAILDHLREHPGEWVDTWTLAYRVVGDGHEGNICRSLRRLEADGLVKVRWRRGLLWPPKLRWTDRPYGTTARLSEPLSERVGVVSSLGYPAG